MDGERVVIGLLVTLGSVALWLAGAVLAGTPIAQHIADKGRCHGKYEWRYQFDCRRYDNAECWHPDAPQFTDALKGFGFGLTWPLAWLPFLVYKLAQRETHPRLLTAEQLRALEKEAGIAS